VRFILLGAGCPDFTLFSPFAVDLHFTFLPKNFGSLVCFYGFKRFPLGRFELPMRDFFPPNSNWWEKRRRHWNPRPKVFFSSSDYSGALHEDQFFYPSILLRRAAHLSFLLDVRRPCSSPSFVGFRTFLAVTREGFSLEVAGAPMSFLVSTPFRVGPCTQLFLLCPSVKARGHRSLFEPSHQRFLSFFLLSLFFFVQSNVPSLYNFTAEGPCCLRVAMRQFFLLPLESFLLFFFILLRPGVRLFSLVAFFAFLFIAHLLKKHGLDTNVSIAHSIFSPPDL